MDDVLVGDDVDDAMGELFSKGYLWVRKDPETGELEIKLAEDVRAAVTVLGPPYHQWTAADPLDRLSVHLIMPLLPLELPDMPPSGSGGRAVGPQESSGIPGITS